MSSELLSLLVQHQDAQRYLVYILKNAAYDPRCNEVADAHYKDMQAAIANCRRVIDQVLISQHEVCNQHGQV